MSLQDSQLRHAAHWAATSCSCDVWGCFVSPIAFLTRALQIAAFSPWYRGTAMAVAPVLFSFRPRGDGLQAADGRILLWPFRDFCFVLSKQ